MNDNQQETKRDLAFANLMERACRAYQVKKLDAATFNLYHDALARFPIEELRTQLDRHIATSEFFPKVVDFKPPDYSGREGEEEDKIYAYGEPHHPIKNPHGNPHFVRLPEGRRRRQMGERIEAYKRRMGDEVSFAMYPEKWTDGALVRPDYTDPARLRAFREKMGDRGSKKADGS